MKKSFINKYLVNLILNKTFAANELLEKYEDIQKIKDNLYFYKYYSLTDKYTFSNIKNSIIHFSNPCNFNDPFDSFMGLSVDSLLKAYVKKFIIENMIKCGTVTKEQIKLFDMLFDEPNNDNLVDELDKTGLLSDILEGKKPEELNKDEIASLCFNYVFKRGEFLGKMHNNKLVEDLIKNEILSSNYIRKKLDSEVKKSIDINLFSSKNLIDEIENFLVVSNIDYDLTEDKEKIRQLKEKFFSNLREKISNEFRMTCFSERYNDILMWSHYGDKHNGICVEYDFMNCNAYLQMLLFPVLYDIERPALTEKQFVLNEEGISYEEASIIELLSKSLLIKSNVWEYEKEWRVILPKTILDDYDNYTAPKISKIYFGVNVSESLINDVMNSFKTIYPNIKYIQLKMNDKEYAFIENEIE